MQGEGWEQVQLVEVRLPPVPVAALPVDALHTLSRVQFAGDCPLAAPHWYTAESGVGVLVLPGAMPLFADGARAVAGPPLPFVENLQPESLATFGHCLLQGSVSQLLLQRMRAEAGHGDQAWQNIFNDVAP